GAGGEAIEDLLAGSIQLAAAGLGDMRHRPAFPLAGKPPRDRFCHPRAFQGNNHAANWISATNDAIPLMVNSILTDTRLSDHSKSSAPQDGSPAATRPSRAEQISASMRRCAASAAPP